MTHAGDVTGGVVALTFLAALLHATWNAMAHAVGTRHGSAAAGGQSRARMSAMVSASAGVLSGR